MGIFGTYLIISYLCPQNICLTRAFQPCERAEGVTAGGSVYLRSQPGAAAKERPGETVQGRGEHDALSIGRKHALLSCIGICRQVGTAAAHR